jgi:dolichol-phosphate mannosyltransferase
MTTLSIVIPCFNEEHGIDNLREQLDPVLPEIEASYDVELVFVDDGSTDHTGPRIRDLWPHARIISHERNLGLGAALRSGAAAARGELVLYIDSDCTYRPREIPQLLACLSADVDIVTASPYHRRGRVVGVPRRRLVLSQVLSTLYQILTGSRVSTYTAMFRVYRREVLAAPTRWSDGYVALAETLVLPLLAGYRVRKYPTTLHARQFSFSKIKIMRTIRAHLGFIRHVLWLRLTRRRIPPPEREVPMPRA